EPMGRRERERIGVDEMNEREPLPRLPVAEAAAVDLDVAVAEHGAFAQMSRMRGRTLLPKRSSARVSGSSVVDPGGCNERSSTPAPTRSRQRRTCSTT